MRGELEGGTKPVMRPWPQAPDALRPGTGTGHGKPVGGWSKAQFAQGAIPGKLLSGGLGEGNGEERSAARGYVISHRTDGDCAATVSVRSAVAVRPEQWEAAAPLPVSSSYAAGVGKRPELAVRSNRRV